jgi:phosphoglycerate dehydrogenase-like enzyme
MADLNIERLSLNLSGLSEGESRHLARLIADGLAEAQLPDVTFRREVMQSNITAHAGGSTQELSDRIVAEVVRQLAQSI